jgi:hypothetical protein
MCYCMMGNIFQGLIRHSTPIKQSPNKPDRHSLYLKVGQNIELCLSPY